MRPAPQQYFYAQQQQTQAAHLNSGLLPPRQSPPFLSPHYPQQIYNGVQVMGLPMGAAMIPFVGPQRGVPLQNGLLQQQWAHLCPEPQAWGSPVFPSQQVPVFAQEYMQQQQQLAYLQDIRTPSGGITGAHPQLHGEVMCGTQQWTHSSGGAPVQQDSCRLPDGVRPIELPSLSHGSISSLSRPYDGDKIPGNLSRIGGPGVPSNPRFKGGRNDKVRGGEPVRSQAVSLRCDACDRTFTNSQQFGAHNSTHVKCDVVGCSFEASGRVVKEHKQATHASAAAELPARSKCVKSKESEEEVARWREERKRNYPTTANIKHKAEEMKARKARGELVDEDARKRKERLKEILAKQAELGVPVAEVPAYYISDRYGSFGGKGGRGESSRPGRKESAKRSHDGVNILDVVVSEEDKKPPAKVPRILDGSHSLKSVEPAVRTLGCEVETNKDTRPSREGKDERATEVADPDVLNDQNQSASGKSSEKVCYFFKRGKCKKGKRCEYLHERRQKKKKDAVSTQPDLKRAPTLLAKLLQTDIRRGKSHLLQSLRFFVNNMYLLEFPEKPLKFFDWQEEDADGDSDAEVGRQEKNALEIEKEQGYVNDDRQTSRGGQDNGQGGSDGKAEAVQVKEQSE